MTGKLPSFFNETHEATLNLCLTVYVPVQENLVIIAYIKTPIINAHAAKLRVKVLT